MSNDTVLRDDDTALVVRNARTRSRRRTWRDYEKHSRVYVSAGAITSVVEDLFDRRMRPHTAWRKALVPVLRDLGVDTKGMRWSQYAGCSCPCSPGFVLPTTVRVDGVPVDYGVVLKGAPATTAGCC